MKKKHHIVNLFVMLRVASWWLMIGKSTVVRVASVDDGKVIDEGGLLAN